MGSGVWDDGADGEINFAIIRPGNCWAFSRISAVVKRPDNNFVLHMMNGIVMTISNVH